MYMKLRKGCNEWEDFWIILITIPFTFDWGTAWPQHT